MMSSKKSFWFSKFTGKLVFWVRTSWLFYFFHSIDLLFISAIITTVSSWAIFHYFDENTVSPTAYTYDSSFDTYRCTTFCLGTLFIISVYKVSPKWNKPREKLLIEWDTNRIFIVCLPVEGKECLEQIRYGIFFLALSFMLAPSTRNWLAWSCSIFQTNWVTVDFWSTLFLFS